MGVRRWSRPRQGLRCQRSIRTESWISAFNLSIQVVCRRLVVADHQLLPNRPSWCKPTSSLPAKPSMIQHYPICVCVCDDLQQKKPFRIEQLTQHFKLRGKQEKVYFEIICRYYETGFVPFLFSVDRPLPKVSTPWTGTWPGRRTSCRTANQLWNWAKNVNPLPYSSIQRIPRASSRCVSTGKAKFKSTFYLFFDCESLDWNNSNLLTGTSTDFWSNGNL